MPRTSKVKASKSNTNGQVRVRMYRHGLGDCFLVRFPKANGNGSFNMLIDCGLIGVAADPKSTMQKVVADIDAECDNHIDVVVLTHEHWDHASGFSKQQVQDAFDNIDIDQVWYAWTEDPRNPLGKKLREERAAKVNALQAAVVGLRNSGSPLGMQRADRVESLLHFFGVESSQELQALAAAGKDGVFGKTRSAFDYLAKRRGVTVRYCHPDDPPIALPGVEAVRAYVLGPPEDEGLLKRSAPTRRGKEVYELASDFALDDSLGAAFERLANPSAEIGGRDCPFEASLCIVPGRDTRKIPQKLMDLMNDTWDKAEFDWRRIEFDWTASAETLALNLDSHTNNTSLVLAFELESTDQVLLFTGDAQVGNWLGWQEAEWNVKDGDKTRTVTGPDLLRRTVFYKVGHHGSHNATLRELGLEQMTSEDLVAFVPVFKSQALKNRWDKIPFNPLVKRLEEKTGGRLVLSDPQEPAPGKSNLNGLSAKQKKVFIQGLTIDPLFYEYAFAL